MTPSALTIDVEDYFQVTAFESQVRKEDWGSFPCRVVDNTRRLLEIFARHGVQGTFFILGWVAEHYPDLVREIDGAGHEIGSHSYWHRLIYRQTPAEFREDLQRSKNVLEQNLGKAVELYRAPTFSITRQSEWALSILVEEGFKIDSSIFPIRHHDRYGLPGIRPEIHAIETPAGPIWEAPLSTARFLGLDVPASGGGYFRLYPFSLTRQLFRRVLATGRAVNFYLHPWEIDPDQPRTVQLSRKTRWRHYVNLASTQKKLEQLLQSFPFTTLGKVVAATVGTSASAPETAKT